MLTVTLAGHSCTRFTRGGAADAGGARALVIDPGAFSDPSALDGAAAVLVTHEHVDHLAVDRVVAALAIDPDLRVWGPAVVVGLLREAGVPADRLAAVAGGDTLEVAGFTVQVLGEHHAPIHPRIPIPANVAYLVDDVVLHPGDSFTLPPAGTALEVLLLPISAPWLKLAEAVDYLSAVAPRIAVPIHDAVLSDIGKGVTDRIIGGLAGAVEYRRLAPGEPLQTGTR